MTDVHSWKAVKGPAGCMITKIMTVVFFFFPKRGTELWKPCPKKGMQWSKG